ncbi:MAG TPA: PAS domain S-box protein, partial [Proteobacteria bacterium]|nr:PAS domain S-box protein [Pseudomonadota bacterium]
GILVIWLVILLVKLKKIRFRLRSFTEKEPESNPSPDGPKTMQELEEALRGEKARSNFFFEESQSFNIIIGMDGRIIDLNRALLNIFGVEKEELVGRDVIELVAPDQREECASYIKRHQEDKYTSNQEFEFTGKQGVRRILFGEQHLTIVHDFVPSGILISGIDVTPLRQFELQEGELKQKLALSARMETLGIMAGGIAHDLKNLFNPVLAYPDIILRDLPPDSPMAVQVTRIKSAASRAAELILNFLSLARRGRLELQPININDVVTSYHESMGFKTMESRFPAVAITVHLSDTLPPVMGLAPQLLSVIMNLVRNGCEAIESEGELRVTTSCRKLDSPHKGWQQIPRGEYVVLQISDSGKGIKPEDIRAIFTPFASGKKMGKSGSGLGLVVVSGVIDDMGGYIDLRSELGRGTNFYIYLPTFSEKDSGLELDLTGVERIMVVDDNEDDRKDTCRVLDLLGYEVVSFSGEEALEYLKDHGVALVVLDLMLEFTSGLDLYSKIIEFNPDQKAIIVSGFLNPLDCKRASSLGIIRCVDKPVDRHRLGRAVREEIERS